MNKTSPKIKDLAQRLVAREMKGKKSGATETPGVLVCEKLRPVLATLMGKGGFRGLLARALVLATAEAPWLSAVRVNAEGVIEGLEAPTLQIDAGRMSEGSVALVAQSLGLLEAFIGEDLTLRCVQEAWPQLSLNDAEFGSGGKK